MEQNKVHTYIFYAIGEVFLVVLGILIALQVNNWNNSRIDQLSERIYLQRLSEDLASDSTNYVWTSEALTEKMESLKRLMSLFKHDAFYSADSTQLLSDLFGGRMLSFAHPRVSAATFEELKNTGNFKQIKNRELRSLINNYYADRQHAYLRIESKRLDPSYGDVIDQIIPGFNRDNSQLRYEKDFITLNEILSQIQTPSFNKAVIGEYNFSLFMFDIQQTGIIRSGELLVEIRMVLENGEGNQSLKN